MRPGKSNPDFKRAERFGRLLMEELSGYLRREVRDPRLADLTITEVAVSDDLHYARVFYVARETAPEKRADIQTGLESAAPFLRGLLGKAIHVRHVPELRFAPDPAIEYGAHIDSLLRGLKTGGRNDEP